MLWPRILNPTNAWFLLKPRKLVPTKIKPSKVFVEIFCTWVRLCLWTKICIVFFRAKSQVQWLTSTSWCCWFHLFEVGLINDGSVRETRAWPDRILKYCSDLSLSLLLGVFSGTLELTRVTRVPVKCAKFWRELDSGRSRYRLSIALGFTIRNRSSLPPLLHKP